MGATDQELSIKDDAEFYENGHRYLLPSRKSCLHIVVGDTNLDDESIDYAMKDAAKCKLDCMDVLRRLRELPEERRFLIFGTTHRCERCGAYFGYSQRDGDLEPDGSFASQNDIWHRKRGCAGRAVPLVADWADYLEYGYEGPL
jgi:hypothetical protein